MAKSLCEVPYLNQPLVSIIVPVYNAEVYLGPCLESLRSQTWPNLEIILVNDGSTDGSGQLCAAAARADPRIRFLDQPNKGVSAARNAALAMAEGDHLQFSDSDDLLTPDATETLVRAAQSTGADLVISHFFRVDKDKQAQRGHIKGECLLTRQEFAQEMVKAPANYYYGALWNKLYRRSIVEKQELRFAEDVTWSEDFLFNLEYIRHVRLVAAVPKPLYYYHKRPGSLITSQATLRKVIQMKRDTFDYYKNLYQDLDLYDEQKARVYRYLISTATDGTTITLPGRGEKSRRVRESVD